MRGRITYVTTVPSTPFNLFLVGEAFAVTNVFANTLAAGETQDILLRWGYTHLDPYHSDLRNVSKSAAGVVEVINFLSTQGFRFGCKPILQDRNYAACEYAVIEALNYELVDGTPVSWYPDYDFSTTQYYSCIAEKRLDQKRMESSFYWQFDFDFVVLAAVQIPSTVPKFVYS